MVNSIAAAGSFINSLKICLTYYMIEGYSSVIETGGKIMAVSGEYIVTVKFTTMI